MPEICRFYGIIIRMFADDHLPPHFHAYYNENEILIDIITYRLLAGSFPPKALSLVIEWTVLHQAELNENWHLAKQRKHTFKIAPLY